MNFKFSVREVKSFQKDLSEAVITTLTSGDGQEFNILETGLSPSITLNRDPSLDNGGGTGYRRYSMAEFSNVPPLATPNPGIGAVRGEAAPPGTILEQSEPNPGDEFYLQSGMVRPPPPDQVFDTHEQTRQWRREQIASSGVNISPHNRYCPPVAQIDLSPEQMEMIRNTLASGHNPFVPIVAASPGRVVASNLCPEVYTQPHLGTVLDLQGEGLRVGSLVGHQTTGRNPLADAWDATSAEVRITVQLPIVAHHIDVPVNLSDILPAVTNNAVDAASYLVAEATNRPGLMRSVMEGRGLPPTRTISASVRVDPSDV